MTWSAAVPSLSRRPLWIATAAAVALSLALAALPLKYGAAAAVFLPAAVLVALRPRWLLYVLPLLVPVTYEATLPLGSARVGLLDLALAGAVAGWLAVSVTRRRIELRLGAVGIALLVWLWVQLLSLTGSVSFGSGVAELTKWAELLAVYVLALALLRGGTTQRLVYPIAAAGTGSALYGLLQFATGRGPESFLLFGRFMRAYGTFAQPNPFAGHLGLSLPFALAWGLAASDRSRMERLAMLGCAGVMGLGILASWSRGSWLALVVSLAVMAVLLAPRLALLAAAAAALVGLMFGGGALAGPLAQRALGMGGDVRTLNVSRVEPTDESWAVIERLAHWQAGWYMFAAHPWLGVGIGNYEVVYPLYGLPHWPEPLGHAHNYYLNVLAETGLVGLTAFGLVGIAAARALVRSWRRAHSGQTRALVLAAAGSLAYLSMHNLVDDLFVHSMQAIVGLCLALIVLAASEVA